MPAPKSTPASPEPLPQSGGSYIRQPDGELVQQKPKTTLADLVAAAREPAASAVPATAPASPNTTADQE